MKRRCRTCLQPTTKPPPEKRRVITHLPLDYRCPTCGKKDRARQRADVITLDAHGYVPSFIARRTGLTAREVNAILTGDTARSLASSSDA